ncbi:lipopolysaccharide transport periplasmic protein LptA [Arenimonas sp.]|jgi:lipopolysaccharide export system protein LptA|uniref:lipopolysaccharide transport periplasmic protein LptA n=1 Tax=Arenimonas sp. TaxID=1872635 RepID=UPI0037BFDD1F
MRLNNLLLVFLVAALFAGQSDAKSSDRKQPMDISADNTDALLTDTSESSINGNVLITQGSLKIEADKAVISRVKGDVVKVTLSGSPTRMQQTNDNGDVMNASAKQIIYLISNEQIQLNGSVIIDQARGSMRGESIRYDLKTGRLNGGGNGGRVQMRLNPASGAGN